MLLITSCVSEHIEPQSDICFESEVLPIFQSHCTQSGCHNSRDREARYDLSNYTGILAAVTPGDYRHSEAYKVLVPPFNSMPPGGDALTDAQLTTIVPDLPARCRAEAAKADLADLETDVPDPVAGAVNNPSKAEALGWLFVSEGSKLGAAFLIKRAVGLGLSETFGARHLAEPAGGRAEGWKASSKPLMDLSSAPKKKLNWIKAPSTPSTASQCCWNRLTPQPRKPPDYTGYTPVGAAAGCDLLILVFTISR